METEQQQQVKIEHLRINAVEKKTAARKVPGAFGSCLKNQSKSGALSVSHHAPSLTAPISEVEILKKKLEAAEAERDQLRKKVSGLEQELFSQDEEIDTLEEQNRSSQERQNPAKSLQPDEARIRYLRNLEAELEESVIRLQRRALSRKCLYTDADSVEGNDTRDEFCRAIIERIELLDGLLKRFQRRRDVAEQLGILKSSFIELLHSHAVEPFALEPGTELSIDHRRMIQLVPAPENRRDKRPTAGPRVILQTISPGYRHSRNGREEIIRKAEVILSS